MTIGGVLDLDRDAGELLEQVFADQRRVVAGAARRQDESLGPAQLLGVQVQTAEVGRGVGGAEPAAQRVFQRLGLLVDLLEHVVLEAALVRLAGIPDDLMDRGVHARPFLVEDVPALRGQHTQLVVLQVNDLLGLSDEGAGVAGQEVLIVADAEDQRAAEPGADDHAGAARADDGQAVGSLEDGQRLAHRLDQLAIAPGAVGRAVFQASVSVSL